MASTMKDYAATIQDELRQGLVDMLWQSSRIMPLMHFIQFKGMTYPYSKRTKRPGVGTRGINQEFAIAPGSYAPDVETMSILGGEVKTDVLLQELKPTLRENEIAGTMEAAGLMFDRLFVKGDPSVSGAANEFYGMYPRITGGQIIDAANNGTVVTHELVSQMLDAVKGPNSEKALLMNRTNRRNLSEDVKADAGGKGVFDVGNQLANFDNAKIVEVEKDETDAEIMPFTETQGSSNACSSILCVRFGGAVDERDVQGILGSDLKFMPNGQQGVFIRDIIQMFAGIGVFGGYSAARLRGLKAA